MALIPDSQAPEQAVAFMKYIAGPEGQAVYTKETTHLPTLNALLTDASLFDASHKTFLDCCPTAHSRPPLAAGATYWDALDQRTGFGRAEHQGAAGRAPGGPGRGPAAARRRRLLTT